MSALMDYARDSTSNWTTVELKLIGSGVSAGVAANF